MQVKLKDAVRNSTDPEEIFRRPFKGIVREFSLRHTRDGAHRRRPRLGS